MWKQFVKDYFVFTRKERRGVIVLLGLIFTITVLPLFFPFFIKEESIDHSEFAEEISKIVWDSTARKSSFYSDAAFQNDYSPDHGIKKEVSMFYFDPNTASVQDWVKLGVREKTALSIQKYVSKGGKFYKPDDIRKIFGLSKKDAERLIPFVSIKSMERNYFNKDHKDYPARSSNPYKAKEIQFVNINSGDTSSFKTLPGIGSKLAQRIINFRDKLGGFYSIDQIGETYLLPDSTFQKIRPYLILEGSPIKKININNASLDELRSHPYIRYHLANALVQYKNQHGNFTSVEQIKKIMILTDSVYLKILPYLTLD
ncbi:MAG: helix-hairpin-helix domain-containing protein [Ginsengibacter sp.]